MTTPEASEIKHRCNILDLPNEVSICILQNLRREQLSLVRLVNRHFASLVTATLVSHAEVSGNATWLSHQNELVAYSCRPTADHLQHLKVRVAIEPEREPQNPNVDSADSKQRIQRKKLFWFLFHLRSLELDPQLSRVGTEQHIDTTALLDVSRIIIQKTFYLQNLYLDLHWVRGALGTILHSAPLYYLKHLQLRYAHMVGSKQLVTLLLRSPRVIAELRTVDIWGWDVTEGSWSQVLSELASHCRQVTCRYTKCEQEKRPLQRDDDSAMSQFQRLYGDRMKLVDHVQMQSSGPRSNMHQTLSE